MGAPRGRTWHSTFATEDTLHLVYVPRELRNTHIGRADSQDASDFPFCAAAPGRPAQLDRDAVASRGNNEDECTSSYLR